MSSTVQCKKCEEVNGGPGKFDLQLNPDTLQFACDQGHQYTDLEVEEMVNPPTTPKAGKKKAKAEVSDATEKNRPKTAPETVANSDQNDGFSAVLEGVEGSENANALESPAYVEFRTVWQTEYLPDGDKMVLVRVPEGYIEAVRQEAENEGKTESEWLSERMRESLEGFFVSYQSVERGQFPAPIAQT